MKWTISLVCPEGNHDPIKLPHRELVFLGRSPESRIVDPRCSRKQIQLTADLHTGDVQAVQLGQNSSALDGIEMIRDRVYMMKPTSTVYVLTGCFPQKLEMNKIKEDGEKKSRHKSASDIESKKSLHHENNKDRASSSGETPNLSKNDRVSSSGETPKLSKNDRVSSSGETPKLSKNDRVSSFGETPKLSKNDRMSSSSAMPKLSKNDRVSSSGETPKLSKNDRVSSSSAMPKLSTNGPQSKPSKKRRLSGDINNSNPKKPRLNGESHSGSKKSPKESTGSEDDSEHLKAVAAKLALMKSSAKHLLKPTRPSSTSSDRKFKVPESPVMPESSSTKNGPVSKGPASESRWDQHDTMYVYTPKGLESRRRIAAFDIDGTIITTQSGKVFPTHPEDWRLLYDKVIPKKLKTLHAEGYKVVFISNQLGVSRGKTNIADLKEKFFHVVDEIGIPIQILLSTKGGQYRKPSPGMWNFLTDKLNGAVAIELSQCFYVGDAAGRPKDWAPKKKKDFSNSDRLFALNIGIDFKTPEEYFNGYSTAKFNMPEFDPRTVSPKTHLFEPKDARLTSGKQEVILLTGFPASGKSFFAKKYLEPKGYVHINRDTLGTWQKCVTACKDGMKKGKCVVVDNTNPDVDSRAKYIAAAKACGVPCRCFVFSTTLQHARHNERFREVTDKTHQAINDMIMNTFKKKYVLPEMKEGFTEIVKVNFVPKFKAPKLEELYRMFLLEK